MDYTDFQKMIKEGLEAWIAEAASEEVRQIREIDTQIQELNARISVLEHQRNQKLPSLPTGMAVALGYQTGPISIMPHCYALAKHKGISLEEAKKTLLRDMQK